MALDRLGRPRGPQGGAVPPLPVVLLADHLDIALAAGEDLVGLTYDPSGTIADGVAVGEIAAPQDLSAFVEELSRLELTATMRVLTARERTEELGQDDPRFNTITRLFVAGTNVLVDASSGAGRDAMANAVRTDPVVYLRTRGMIAPDAAGLPEFSTITVTDRFRLCGVVEIGGLMEMTAAFLDALEIHYELFPETEPTVAPDPNALKPN